MIALLAALEGETAGLRRQMALVPEEIAGLDGSAYTGLYRGRPMLLAWTGMGRQRARAGAEAVLAHGPVSVVVSIGFSGALEESLAVGDLVLASSLIGVTDLHGHEVQPTLYPSNPERQQAAVQALGEAPLRVVQGPTVTAPGLIATPDCKRDLGRRTGAVAVDMESYWVAAVAAERDLPFLALRVISDAQREPLPPLDQILDENGAPSMLPLVAHLLRSPGSLIALAKIARNAGRAHRTLTAGVACAVAAL